MTHRSLADPSRPHESRPHESQLRQSPANQALADSAPTSAPPGHGFQAGNPGVRIDQIELLSDNWYTLHRVDFDYRSSTGQWLQQQREVYDRGNGATVLLIDWSRSTVLLTRQFRIPAYLNDHPDGMLIEAPAGLLDNDDAETAIRREAEEETGCRIGAISQLFELFMSPGSVTERVVFFVAEYEPADRVSNGGGLAEEGEDIEVIEIGLADAIDGISTGRIVDGKTVLLLLWALSQQNRSPLGS